MSGPSAGPQVPVLLAVQRFDRTQPLASGSHQPAAHSAAFKPSYLYWVYSSTKLDKKTNIYQVQKMVFQQHQLKLSISFIHLLLRQLVLYKQGYLVQWMLPCNIQVGTYTYVHNMRHEHKLEICVQPQGYDPVGITKTWCHGSLDWLQCRDTGSLRRTGWEDRVEQLFI